MSVVQWIADKIGWELGQGSYNINSIDQVCYMVSAILVLIVTVYCVKLMYDLVRKITRL